MNKLMFFEDKQVEVFELHGGVYFNPYHVGMCLNLSESAVRNHLAKMNEKQAILLKNSDVLYKDFRRLNNAGEKFLSESGVYKIIFKSEKEEAEKFQDWVTDEVLPAIRKHGGYLTNEKIEEVLLNPDTIIQLATALKTERKEKERLLTETKVKDQQIAELKPKADYTDRILKSKGTVPISIIAKDYGMSARRFNKLLNEYGVQYKQGEVWLLYRKFHDKGYTHSKSFDYKNSEGLPQTRITTEWTQKGRLFLYELLKSNGVLPMIERGNISA